jgi:hypothetical protein
VPRVGNTRLFADSSLALTISMFICESQLVTNRGAATHCLYWSGPAFATLSVVACPNLHTAVSMSWAYYPLDTVRICCSKIRLHKSPGLVIVCISDMRPASDSAERERTSNCATACLTVDTSWKLPLIKEKASDSRQSTLIFSPAKCRRGSVLADTLNWNQTGEIAGEPSRTWQALLAELSVI